MCVRQNNDSIRTRLREIADARANSCSSDAHWVRCVCLVGQYSEVAAGDASFAFKNIGVRDGKADLLC